MVATAVILSSAPSDNVVGDSISASDVLTFASTAAADSSVDVFDGTIVLETAAVDGSVEWNFTTGILADGVQNFTVTGIEAADDTGAASAALVVPVETQTPTLPVVDGNGFESTSQVVLTGSAQASYLIGLYDGPTALGSMVANDTGAWTVVTQPLSNEAHSSGALVVPVETQALAPPLIDGDVLSGTSGVVSNGAPELSTGVHTLYATATDAEEQAGPPIIASISGYGAVSNGAITSDDVLILGGTAVPDTTVIVYDSTHLLGTAVVNSNGNWEFTTEQLGEGAQKFTAVDQDASGNLSTASSVFTATVETLSGGAPANIGVNMEGAEYSWGSFATLVDLEYVKSEGVNLVRLPIAWEMMQPTLNGPLDSTYLAGLETFLSNAASLGIQVIVDLHDAGTYNLNWAADAAANYGIVAPNAPDASKIGSAAVPISAFANFWQQLATALNGNPAVAGYDIMNEPNNMPSPSTWPDAAQAAVNAIRTVDMNTPIIVEGDEWANAEYWNAYNANLKITDPANLIIYEAHQYFDNGSGTYTETYTQAGDNVNTGVQEVSPFLQWLQANNYKGYVGELGIPSDNSTTAQWLPLLNNVLNTLQADGVPATVWNFEMPNSSPSWWVSQIENSSSGNLNIAPWNGQINPIMTLIFEHSAPVITSFSPNSGIVGDNIVGSNVLTLTGTGAGQATVYVYDGATLLGTTTSGTDGVWSFTTRALASGAHTFTTTDVDSSGDISEASNTLSVTIDVAPPTVTSLVTSPANGDLSAGHVVTLTLNMSEAVTVANGTPALTLNDGGTATYTGGSGASALTFSYTVAAGQNTPDLTVSAVNLNGATIADAAGNNASLSGTFNPTGTLQIDTATPTVTSIVSSGTGITSGSGDLGAGHVVTLTLNLSEAVTVNITGGTPTLTLNDGATATYTGGSGTSTLTFSYTVAAGQDTPDLTISAVNLNGAAIADAAGNNASLSGTFNPTGTLQIDTSTPTVTSVTASGSGISSGNGDVGAGHVVTLTLNLSESVTVANGTPALTLNDGGTATYTGGSGTSTLTFSYMVAAGQNTPDLTVSAVNLNGATIADTAGNSASLSGTFNPTGTLQIDTATPPQPIISTDAINANNSITLTGTAEANSTLTIYNGQTALGTTTATASGVWSYTTGPLESGAQVFTATATDAAGNTSALSDSVDPIIGSATTTEIAAIYNAVLQRAPTDTEVTASLAIDSTLGSSGMIAAIVDSAEAITNVYPILQMFDLAFGRFPSAATLASMVDTELSVSQLAAAVVASQTFADTYNGGALINPNSPLTAGIVDAFYSQALGHAPTQETLNGWLNGGLTVVQAFLAMVMSQAYFETAQPAIEQYLTTAAINNEGYPVSGTAPDLNPTHIGAIYEAVLQRAPTATEVTASLALDSATGNVGVIAALVDSAEAITNVYPILQMFDLAFGHFPVAATLASMVETGLAVPQLASAIVASQTFADIYNDGALINPNSPVTANIVEVLYTQALGHAPTQATLNGWLSGGLTVAQAFEDMVTSESYFATTQTSIEQYLTAAAISEAGLTTINGTQASGALELGTAMMPLTQPDLTVLGGSGALTVVASGASDIITELNTSTAGGTITANGLNDTIDAANGPNTITAKGAGNIINLGVVSTGISITSAQTIHAGGAGDVITFATTAGDGSALTWAVISTVDGGNSSTGIGANSTVNFGNNIGGGSETVVVTGDLTGTTTSGGTSATAIAMITLGNVVDGAGDQITFNNAATEVLASTNAMNVTGAGSLAQALDIAASAAGSSQSGGMIPAHTGVIDWFQYAGNTYVVEAINSAVTAQSHAALATTDEVIKIVGLVNLPGESLVGHALTL